MVWPSKQNASEKPPNNLYLPKQMGKKNNWMTQNYCRWIYITLRIVGGIAWDFTQAKW